MQPFWAAQKALSAFFLSFRAGPPIKGTMKSISITKIAAAPSTLVGFLPSKRRALRSRLLKTVALTLVAAATVQMPQFAREAHAGTRVYDLNDGDIIKIKTIWGGGYALNVGGTAGSNYAGTVARTHWNTGWDSPNRYTVQWSTFYSLGGFRWVALRNRHSGMCLAVDSDLPNSTIRQQTCSSTDDRQFFAMPNPLLGQIGEVFFNLADFRANRKLVLSQVDEQFVGGLIAM